MSYGSELQAVGPVTENTRSPSLDLVGGTLHYTTSCIYFASAAVIVDSSHMTASSSALNRTSRTTQNHSPGLYVKIMIKKVKF